MSGTIYRLVTEGTATNPRTERRGTVRDARKLALATKGDVDLYDADQTEFGGFTGRVLYARGGGFRLHERIYGTFYTRGIFAEALYRWRNSILGRIHFQSPIQSPFYISPRG